MFDGTDGTGGGRARRRVPGRAPLRLGVTLGAATVAVLMAGTASAATGWVTVPAVDPSPAGNTLTAVSARTGTDAWAVGFFDNPVDDTGRDGLAEHWNGQRWQRFTVPSTLRVDERLLAVGGSAADDVWAVGARNATGFASTNPLIDHWNGTAWTAVAIPSGVVNTALLTGISAVPGTGETWAVGTNGGRSLALHHTP
jgi:hypothetical protein